MRFFFQFFIFPNECALTSLQINNEELNKIDCVRKSGKCENKKVEKFGAKFKFKRKQ